MFSFVFIVGCGCLIVCLFCFYCCFRLSVFIVVSGCLFVRFVLFLCLFCFYCCSPLNTNRRVYLSEQTDATPPFLPPPPPPPTLCSQTLHHPSLNLARKAFLFILLSSSFCYFGFVLCNQGEIYNIVCVPYQSLTQRQQLEHKEIGGRFVCLFVCLFVLLCLFVCFSSSSPNGHRVVTADYLN